MTENSKGRERKAVSVRLISALAVARECVAYAARRSTSGSGLAEPPSRLPGGDDPVGRAYSVRMENSNRATSEMIPPTIPQSIHGIRHTLA
jgi:hypothetical protein